MASIVRSVHRWLAPGVLVLVLAACGGGEGAAPPAIGSQTVAPDRLPSPSVGAATLSWNAPFENVDGSPLVNLAGFKIYYGRSADALDWAITVNNASISTYIVENLTSGTWYFGVAAINSVGVESPLSNIASKTIN